MFDVRTLPHSAKKGAGRAEHDAIVSFGLGNATTASSFPGVALLPACSASSSALQLIFLPHPCAEVLLRGTHQALLHKNLPNKALNFSAKEIDNSRWKIFPSLLGNVLYKRVCNTSECATLTDFSMTTR